MTLCGVLKMFVKRVDFERLSCFVAKSLNLNGFE